VLLLAITDDLTSGKHYIAEYLMDLLRYLPTYLPELSKDLADLVRTSSSVSNKTLQIWKGPSQVVLTREQNKIARK
jgi:hypothetical protein